MNSALAYPFPFTTNPETPTQDNHDVFSFDDDIFPYNSKYDPQICIHQRDVILPRLNAPCFSNS